MLNLNAKFMLPLAVALTLALLIGCQPKTSAPDQATSPPADSATSTVAQNPASVCDITKDQKGRTVAVSGTIGIVDTKDPEGTYADLEDGRCHIGIWVPKEREAGWTAAQKELLATGRRVIAEGEVLIFDGNPVIDLTKPLSEAADINPTPETPPITASPTVPPATPTTPTATAPDVNRTLIAEPAGEGEYAVGSSYFMYTREALNDPVKANDPVYHLGGVTDNGHTVTYIDDILDQPGIHFEVEVPEDPPVYGSAAGTTVPYSGFLLYPTTPKNPYAYQFPQIDEQIYLPHLETYMQGADEASVFAAVEGRWPLVVFSVGLGGEPLGDFEDMAWLAAHGYAVLTLFPGDDRFAVEEPNPAPLQNLTMRQLSVKASIDYLAQHPDYKDHIDFDRIGGWGESYGGTTMFAIMGGKIIDLNSMVGVLDNTVQDSRIKAAVGIVPYMGDSNTFPVVMGLKVSIFGLQNAGAQNVNGPYLAVSGTADTVAMYDYTKETLETAQGEMYLVKCEDKGHDLVISAREDALTWGLVFLRAYVDGYAEALAQFREMQSVKGGAEDSFVPLNK